VDGASARSFRQGTRTSVSRLSPPELSLKTARVLVVDGTTLYRNLITEALADIDSAEAVGSAPNGSLALKQLQRLAPDLVLLDAELPEADSLEILRQMLQAQPETGVVLTSNGSPEATEIAVQALHLGALDIVSKPSRTEIAEQPDRLRADLKRLTDASLTKRLVRGMPRSSGSRSATIEKPSRAASRQPEPVQPVVRRSATIQAVGIGISTGGPKALSEIVPRFSASFPVPILLVQHMPEAFTEALTSSLNTRSAIRVVMGEHGQSLEGGVIYLAPGGRQMKVVADGTQNRIALTDDPPENHCRPAADYLFRSMAEIYGPRSLGVVMTGMGADGREGLRLMKAQGAHTVAQDEATSLVFGMPMEAIKAGVVDDVVSLDDMADTIARIVAGNV
jgi:two-component system, chemotaxis family, protein-glutamate methylesterase/glutaminase